MEGKTGSDTLFGGGGADTFVFHVGEAVGHKVIDFTSGADHFEFFGYGAGTFTQVNATFWSIQSADGTIFENLNLNGASVAAGDYLFF
jgi:Ca2+-binding RTX toxin-like protein